MRRLSADGRRMFDRVLVVTALMALRLSLLSAEPVPLKDVVTPSSVLMKDGKPVMFAIHGFVEFRSLAEAFAYIESQRKRWKGKISEEELNGLEKALLREAVESRVVSMTDERAGGASNAHERRTTGRGCGRERDDAEGVRGGASGSARKMAAFAEMLERFARDCGESAFELVSD